METKLNVARFLKDEKKGFFEILKDDIYKSFIDNEYLLGLHSYLDYVSNTTVKYEKAIKSMLRHVVSTYGINNNQDKVYEFIEQMDYRLLNHFFKECISKNFHYLSFNTKSSKEYEYNISKEVSSPIIDDDIGFQIKQDIGGIHYDFCFFYELVKSYFKNNGSRIDYYVFKDSLDIKENTVNKHPINAVTDLFYTGNKNFVGKVVNRSEAIFDLLTRTLFSKQDFCLYKVEPIINFTKKDIEISEDDNYRLVITRYIRKGNMIKSVNFKSEEEPYDALYIEIIKDFISMLNIYTNSFIKPVDGNDNFIYSDNKDLSIDFLKLLYLSGYNYITMDEGIDKLYS